MNVLKLIVFDCDGVLFDSRRANREYYNHLLKHFRHPPMDESELEYAHMHSASDSVRHIFRNYPENSFEEIEAFRRELGYERFLPHMRMEEDLMDFLHIVKDKFHLAISTNRGNTMEPLLRIFGLQEFFAKVVTSQTAVRSKPAPDGLIEILNHFQCTAAETIFIGDSIIDSEHASSCDVPLIAFKNKDLPAKFHVSSFMEILTLPPLRS
ncbi:HAD family hydrolase [Desulfopila inferna]|uniref:HAD family hydrolase n=1 Tax=Desulfopila inferna TaxID=468528 RepID=UPI0019660D98|nr:HAD family hydrolase [Desulfopila inferna]MBM9605082.1 HAD family hydrolase [Desulfopila inferna]